MNHFLTIACSVPGVLAVNIRFGSESMDALRQRSCLPLTLMTNECKICFPGGNFMRPE